MSTKRLRTQSQLPPGRPWDYANRRLAAMAHESPVKPEQFLAMLEAIRTPRREELLAQYHGCAR